MISQSFVAVLIGMGIGLLYYIINSNNEEERQHGYRSGGSTTSDRTDASPGSSSSSQYNQSRSGGSTTRRSSSSQSNDFRKECSICISETVGNNLVKLPCSHVFHKACILEWRKKGPQDVQQSCPNCRNKFSNHDF